MSNDDPFRHLQNEVERMFRQLVYNRNLGAHFGDPTWAPPTDVMVSRDAARVTVELAGVPRERIKVELQGNLLEIRGRRTPPPPPEEGTHYHRAEIWFGDFRRVIELPWVADQDKVDARYRDGMLEIHLVPAPSAQHTAVTIEHGEI